VPAFILDPHLFKLCHWFVAIRSPDAAQHNLSFPNCLQTCNVHISPSVMSAVYTVCRTVWRSAAGLLSPHRVALRGRWGSRSGRTRSCTPPSIGASPGPQGSSGGRCRHMGRRSAGCWAVHTNDTLCKWFLLSFQLNLEVTVTEFYSKFRVQATSFSWMWRTRRNQLCLNFPPRFPAAPSHCMFEAVNPSENSRVWLIHRTLFISDSEAYWMQHESLSAGPNHCEN